MPENFKDKEPKKSSKPSKDVQEVVVVLRRPARVSVKMKVTKCHIRIEKPGRSFKQIRGQLERALFPKRNTPLGKSIFKALSGNGIIIKGFVQECLADYFKGFMKQNGNKKAECPFIINYSEKSACIDITFNIVYDPSLDPIMKLFVDGFVAYLMKKLAEKLISKNDSDKEVGPITKINEIHIGDIIVTNMGAKDKLEDTVTDDSK